MVVVSNREPYSHTREGGRIRWVRNAGGLTVALDAVMRPLGGLWVAHGSGSADRETADENGRVSCPPDRPTYTLRRVWLSESDHQHYYAGLANGALWPLCHIVYVRPQFRLDDWESYQDVNRRFAEAVLAELDDRPALVLLQDYHLALVARYLKEWRPDLKVAMFWHIPWPNAEVFRVLPWRDALLDGLLANDMIGFHIRRHALNFLESVGAHLEAIVDQDRLSVDRAGHRTWVRPFAISVPADEIAALSEMPEARAAEARWRKKLRLGERKMGIGVDRLDYTKGIPERLEALHRMLERYPEWRDQFSFVQVGVPTRIELEEYRTVRRRTRELVRKLNSDFPRGDGSHMVHYIEDNLDFRDLVPLYRMADLCAVTSLHDGMNLVAKEYLAACNDEEGALVLSPYTGAARELERAYIASPYDIDGLAETLHQALSEPAEQRRDRMRALRETVFRRNIYDWAIEFLDTFEQLALRTPSVEAGESH